MNRLIALSCIALLLLACKRQAGSDAPVVQPTANPHATSAAGPVAKPTTPGKPALPSLKVTTLDGTVYDLAAHRGKWVVVNFWATWCAPCLKEMPELSALDATREHIEVIGLAFDDIEPAQMQVFLRTHPVVYPIAIVDTFAPPADFDAPRGLPMTYLIAPDGRVARQFLGPVTAKDVEAAIATAGGPKAG